MTENVLITGGSSLLALNWALTIRNKFNVIFGIHNREFSLNQVKQKKINLDNYDVLINDLKTVKPKIIIHTAGLTSIEDCEKNVDFANYINVNLACNVTKACKELDISLVHISTDHLFNNQGSYIKEKNKVSPVNVYGQSKAEAEIKVLKINPKALVIRTNFFGWGPFHRLSFSDRILEALSFKKSINLFQDVFFTSILIEELANIVHDLVNVNASGIINVAGNQRVSKYDFGVKLAKKFNYDYKLIKPDNLKNNSKLVKRPFDMSLSIEKSEKLLGKKYGNIDENIDKLFKQKENGIANELRPYTPYGKHHLDNEDINSVVKTLNSGWLTQGKTVQEFEERFASYVGAKYAVAVSNCSSGLHIAARVAGLGKGDLMITSSVTFVASANAAIHNNADICFTDIDLDNINMSIPSLEDKVKSNINAKVIMPVHFGGYPCDMELIKSISEKNGLHVIEDAAHALGAKYFDGTKVGNCSYSLMTVFSFHPVKAITLGEGGIITTNDKKIYRRLYRLRSHGINKLDDKYINLEYSKEGNLQNPWYYEMQELGFNFRITDIQCALGISQLKKIDKFISKRRELACRYDEAFKSLKNIKLVQSRKKDFSGHHLYIIKINFKKIHMSRAELMNCLKNMGIGSQVHYIPLPIHPYYRNLNFNTLDYPNAMKYYEEALSIPLFFDLTSDQHNYIINTIRNYIG